MLIPIILEHGVNLVLVSMWLKERSGEEGFNEIKNKLSPKTCEDIENPSPGEWYPVSCMREIFDAVAAEFCPRYPDALVDYGRFAAEKSVKGFLRYLTRFLSMNQLIKRMGAFWKQYHKGGSLTAGEVTEENGRRKVLVTVQSSELGTNACQVIHGYLHGVIPLTNVSNIKIEKLTCVHKGNDSCSWLVSWDK